ncbi:unnamed protein product, partial [marine sediment metagenome]
KYGHPYKSTIFKISKVDYHGQEQSNGSLNNCH